MSNHAIRSYHDRNESGKQPIRSYQAVWMAHWSRTCREASLAQNNLEVNRKPMEGIPLPVTKQQQPNLSGPDAATNASHCSSKEFMGVPVAGPANVPDESVTVVSHPLRKERLENNQPFLMFDLSKNQAKSVLAIKDDLFHGQPVHQFNPMSGLDASRRDLVKPDKMSEWSTSRYEIQSQEHPRMGGTSHDLVKKNSLHVSASFKDDFFTSNSRNPFGKSAGRLEKVNSSSTFLTARGRLLNMNLTKLDPDQCNYHGSSAVFIHQQHNDPLMGKNKLAFFLGDSEYQKSLKDCLASGFFQSQTGTFNITEAECSTQPSNTFIDVETMRIYTTIDSVEGSKFHRTTEELFCTEKKTDVNLLKGGNIIQESTVSSAQFNTFTEFLGQSQDGGFKSHQQGVKLQPLWSSTDSEEKENAADLENESSAKPNTMVMDTLKEGHPCGEEVLPLNEEYIGFPKLLASTAAAKFMSGEGSGRENADLPNSRWNCLTLPSAILSSTDDKEPSVSKTQSLDMALLFPDTDGQMATNSKSRSTQSVPDPGSRWMKRLKISGSESWLGHGTKTSKMEQTTSSPEKFNPFSRQTLKRLMSGSETLISNKSCEKKQIVFDWNEQLVMKDGGSSSISESKGKSRDELLSCAWIRRWCRTNSQAPKKSEGGREAAFVFCKSHSVKASLDEIQKKQLPSISAMALMGKAMNAFRPCELKKRGTFVVWNNK